MHSWGPLVCLPLPPPTTPAEVSTLEEDVEMPPPPAAAQASPAGMDTSAQASPPPGEIGRVGLQRTTVQCFLYGRF